MQKTAQKRSVLNKLREMTNVSGIAAEKFFNPEFQRVMESLRAKDDQIRSIVSGEAIGEGDPGADSISLKDLIKTSKSNLNRREYMSAIADLGRFHKKLFDVTQEIKNLGLDVDSVHHEFLFKDLGDEQKKHLQDLKTRFARAQRMEIIKEAGVMDFFYNIGTKRGRALAAWEKRYPKQVGKLKKDTSMLHARSEALLAQVLSALKEMASARSVRNVDNYIKGADKITKGYQSYDKTFKDFYNSNVKGFLEKVELIAPTAKMDDSKDLGKKEVPVEDTRPEGSLDMPGAPSAGAPDTIRTGPPDMSSSPPKTENIGPAPGAFVNPEHVAPTMPAPSSSMPLPLMQRKDTIPVGPPSGMSVGPVTPTLPSPGMATVPPSSGGPTLPPSAGPTIPSPPPSHEFKSDQLAQEMWGKKAHAKFFRSLESLSNESPLMLASYITKYARIIQETDPSVSIQLFKIAKNIKG